MHGRKAGLTPGSVSCAPIDPNVRYLEVKHSHSGNRLASDPYHSPWLTLKRLNPGLSETPGIDRLWQAQGRLPDE
jgi:hypothetical protein